MGPPDASGVPGAAVIVAGGAGRRMGGADKPALQVGGHALLRTALAAVAGARVVVVGPERTLPDGVLSAREEPPGGGPAAAVAAGMAVLHPEPSELVAVLAADLPGITAALLHRLGQLTLRSGLPGALAVDENGRRQLLIGVWRAGSLAASLASRPSWQGSSMRDLLDPLRPATLVATDDEIADIDTPADLQAWEHRCR